MKKSIQLTIATLFVITSTLVFSQNANARGLLGEKYIGVQMGVMKPGDDFLKDVDNSIVGMSVGFNSPLNANTDFLAYFSYEKLEGDYFDPFFGTIDVDGTAKGIMAGIKHHFSPTEQTDLFIGARAGFIKSKITRSIPGFSVSDTETEFAFGFDGGVEIDLSEQSAVRPRISYTNVDSNDDFGVGITFVHWLEKDVFGIIAISRWLEDGDMVYTVGMGVSF